ncbi:unnamed protein product [Mycena citricolor]|uniref:Uncharacterized protein n=1 Tax=Mycena citricolor TaxID=2018698 RepID=A0AAD2H9R0_9AGAR|nr:unnamed protein product [Mycena citricolor]
MILQLGLRRSAIRAADAFGLVDEQSFFEHRPVLAVQLALRASLARLQWLIFFHQALKTDQRRLVSCSCRPWECADAPTRKREGGSQKKSGSWLTQSLYALTVYVNCGAGKIAVPD